MSETEKTAAIGAVELPAAEVGPRERGTTSSPRAGSATSAKSSPSKRLTVDEMVKHGVKPYQAEKAYAAVHTAEHEAVERHRQRAAPEPGRRRALARTARQRAGRPAREPRHDRRGTDRPVHRGAGLGRRHRCRYRRQLGGGTGGADYRGGSRRSRERRCRGSRRRRKPPQPKEEPKEESTRGSRLIRPLRLWPMSRAGRNRGPVRQGRSDGNPCRVLAAHRHRDGPCDREGSRDSQTADDVRRVEPGGRPRHRGSHHRIGRSIFFNASAGLSTS